MQAFLQRYGEVNGDTFEEPRIPESLAEQIQETWQAFLQKYSSREIAGESIFDAIMEEAPSLQSLFKSPRSVFGLRFTTSLTNIIMECKVPSRAKRQVETLGFQHLDLEVTTPRVDIIRDAILGTLESELGEKANPRGRLGLQALLNYIGGTFIFVHREFADRIRIIQRSWKTANGKDADAVVQDNSMTLATLQSQSIEETNAKGGEAEAEAEIQDNEEIQEILRGCGDRAEAPGSQMPTTFSDMFLFNASVMGYGESKWMRLILQHLDDIATNVANTYRLQEECDVLSVVLGKYKGQINLVEFKAVMLASLRSVVPKDWDMNHEVAWNWLWENVERMLKEMMGIPLTYEKALRNWILDLPEDVKLTWRKQLYKKFFENAPSAQDFLKQSTGRLHFIADRILAMTLDMYCAPRHMVDDVSALGLRHVGYGVPTELFSPHVAACVEAVAECQSLDNSTHVDAFRWSLTLISKMLVRVIVEGSTLVMKAINTNQEASLKKAVALAPRVERADVLLNITCGTQSISPLYWAIDSGSLRCARAIIEDLLTIRADRDVYYYGCDALFTRHPDLIHQMCLSAPSLLEPLLDGLVWRSRSTNEGRRRVNYYVKHLVQDLDGHFSETLSWLVEFQDPHVVSHPAATLAADIVWFRFAVFYFLRGRCYLLFTLCIFIAGQAVLGKHAGLETFQENIAIFCCRCFLYFGSMCVLIYNQVKLAYLDIKRGAIDRSYIFPIPEYLFNVQQALYMSLVLALVIMFFLEPILWCIKQSSALGSSMGANGTYIFTENCPEAQDKGAYSIFSCLAMLLYWALLVDFAVISMRVSAFVLVCGRVISEVALFGSAVGFLVVAFSTAINTLNHHLLEFDGVQKWLYALLQMALGMYDTADYVQFREEVAVLVAVSAFIAVVLVVLMNLLVAQLTEAYHCLFKDMQGYARLNRAAVIVAVMEQVLQKRWTLFLASLNFEERMEFNEGDIGLAGGVQILEPANASVVTEDCIKRYGGSTAPSKPWPEDDTSAVEEDRFERLEKLILKTHKKSGGRASRRHAGSSSASLSVVSGGSDTSE